MSPRPNRLSRLLASIDRLPAPARTPARSLALGKVVPFVGTAGIRVTRLGPDGGTFELPYRRRVGNHIKGVHAAATALLAETATGMVLGVHVPDDKLPLLKSMQLDYVKRAKGGLRAEAHLTPEQIAAIASEERGDVTVAVTVTDDAGNQPVRCEMTWAWVPKRR